MGNHISRTEIIPIEQVSSLIRIVRGQKVMLDEDLAQLYEVETRTLNRAVRRHLDRFPNDFMIELTLEEYRALISQIGTSKSDTIGARGGRRKPPLAFTEQGVAMLSTVLNSSRAIQVNISIMRTFVRLREILSGNKKLAQKLLEMERRYDNNFNVIFEAIGQLLSPTKKSQNRPIGFGREKK